MAYSISTDVEETTIDDKQKNRSKAIHLLTVIETIFWIKYKRVNEWSVPISEMFEVQNK